MEAPCRNRSGGEGAGVRVLLALVFRCFWPTTVQICNHENESWYTLVFQMDSLTSTPPLKGFQSPQTEPPRSFILLFRQQTFVVPFVLVFLPRLMVLSLRVLVPPQTQH